MLIQALVLLSVTKCDVYHGFCIFLNGGYGKNAVQSTVHVWNNLKHKEMASYV